MEELLQNIDWMQVLAIIWTAIILPTLNYIRKKFEDFMHDRKLDKYSNMLIDAVDRVVKDSYETIVKDIKGTDKWTDDKQREILENTKTKTIIALTTEGYNFLQVVHSDLDAWITTLIEAKLYDLKHQG